MKHPSSTKDQELTAHAERTLRELPPRVAGFLHVLATQPEIRAGMERGGYVERDHCEGLSLLTRACSTTQLGRRGHVQDLQQRQAEQALEGWLSEHVLRLRAAVRRRHPLAPDPFVDGGLSSPGEGVFRVSALLRRLEELELSPHGSVLETLSQRGLSKAERLRLGELVRVAQSAADPRGAEEARSVEPQADNASALLALRDWYEDWSTTARALIPRKDWLIRLGVRRRRG